MKTKVNLLIGALAVVAAAACGGHQETEAVPAQVRIEPVITRATEVNFENGDRIGLSVVKDDGSVYAENEPMTYGDGAFAGDLKWYADGGVTSSLSAYYPYSEAGYPSSWTVGSDQRSGAGAWDLMLAAKQSVKPQEAPVVMDFHHQLSQVILKVEGDGPASISKAELKGLLTTIHFSDGTSSADGQKGDIIMEEVTPGKRFRAIVVPQTMAFGVSVTTSSGSCIVESFTEVTMLPGYSYTIVAKVSSEGIAFGLSGEIHAWEDGGTLEPGDNPPAQDDFEEHDGYFTYAGVDYATVTLPDGQVWMAAPLAYLPAGMTVSSDPTEGGIWYPYTSDGQTVTVLTDDASVIERGYLYGFDAIFGTAIDESNYDKFEGARGICPPGWHVPTRAEWFSLCGASNASKYLGESGTQTDDSALFWDKADGYASVPSFNAGGFNFTLSGVMVNNKYQTLLVDSSVCTVPELYGNNRMTYVASSSPNSTTQFFVAMTTFTSAYGKGRVSLAFAPLGKAGVQVRCVRDK